MELSDSFVSRYSLIRNRKIVVNGKKLIEEEKGADFSSFLSSVYKTFFGSEYPKFFKMDLLSKLGLLTADFLVDSGKYLKPYYQDQIAIVASNAQSSLETDTRYFETIADKNNYYPNPGLFVYTLPNLLMGEISIKYSIRGESIFFISRMPDFHLLCDYASLLLDHTDTEAVITGWVDLDPSHQYESILFLVEKQNQSVRRRVPWPLTPEALEYLYFEKNLEE